MNTQGRNGAGSIRRRTKNEKKFLNWGRRDSPGISFPLAGSIVEGKEGFAFQGALPVPFGFAREGNDEDAGEAEADEESESKNVHGDGR